MPDTSPKLYEGMFLLTQGATSAGADQALGIVRGFLEQVEADIVTCYRWEERKLAYPVAGQKRGTFFLTLFNATPDSIEKIERACNLSEDVLRVMMTRADHMGEVEIEQAKKAAEGLPVDDGVGNTGDGDAAAASTPASPAAATASAEPAPA